MSFHQGSGVTEACSFVNIIPRYGPHTIVQYLSQYVTTKDTSASLAEDGTSDYDAEANCVIC
jgi:hypothetical protein